MRLAGAGGRAGAWTGAAAVAAGVEEVVKAETLVGAVAPRVARLREGRTKDRRQQFRLAYNAHWAKRVFRGNEKATGPRLTTSPMASVSRLAFLRPFSTSLKSNPRTNPRRYPLLPRP